MRKATGKVTGKAIIPESQATLTEKQAAPASLVTGAFSITFGTLNFTIQHEQICNPAWNKDATGTSIQGTTPTLIQRKFPSKAKPVHNGTSTETKKKQNESYRPIRNLSQHQMAFNKNKNAINRSDPLTHHRQEDSCAKENVQMNVSKANQDTKAQKTKKFIKVPPPTNQWQTVQRRKKVKTNENLRRYRRCFYCNKEGHIRKYCWKRIKCFNCGNFGHKCAKCPFKSFHPTLSARPAKITTETVTPSLDPSPQTMEQIHGRPPLGDLFYPTNQTLTEDNDYLRRVGLIILIRGAPSQNMPQLIASKLRETHGGHLSDYRVAQATISPYVVSCRNVQTWDAIVQSGLYSVAQGRIQFAVHEWRPRFGMGFDPPTHQVWVKIIGLPLQAWKTPRIKEILQRIGHPLHILPFGNEAGHFRDITAMVDTKHPRRIPMAYIYREGDYCTQVDIQILSWRIWDHTFFPPPGFPPQNGEQQVNPQPSQNPAPSGYISSSSSSTNAPSEPTIDLSFWSPRSRRSLPVHISEWKGEIHSTNGVERANTFNIGCISKLPPKKSHIAAVENQTTKFQIEQSMWHVSLWSVTYASLWSVKHASLQSVASHFAINPLTLHGAMRISGHILRKIRGNLRLDSHLPSQTTEREINALCLRKEIGAALKKTLEGSNQEYSFSLQGPKILMAAAQKEIVSVRTAQEQTQLQLSPPSAQELTQMQLSLPPAQEQIQLQLSPPPPAYYQQHSDAPNMPVDPYPLQSDPLSIKESPRTFLQTCSKNNTASFLDGSEKRNSLISTKLTTKTSEKKKEKGKMATRRSPRLQEREQPTPLVTKRSAAAKTMQLPFQLHSHEIPLQTSTAIQILQASGLEINQKIHDMIQEANNLDTAEAGIEDAAPSTPLHDNIPPLIVPGQNILL